MASTNIGALSVRITADTNGVTRGINNVQRQLTGSERRLQSNARHWQQWSGKAQLATAALAASVGVAAYKVVEYADTFTSITNKLKLATDGTEQLKIVTDELFESSNRTGSSVAATAALYAKMERSTRNLGVSQDRLLSLTESVNKAFAVSGATVTESSNAILQLGQALDAGVLRGEEFNAMAEQAPLIMEAVRKATGKTAGELRKLAADGAISAEILIESLERYKDKIDGDFSTAMQTYSQKMQIAANNAIKFVGENDKATATVDNFGDALISLSENLDNIANVVGVVLVAAVGKYAGSLVGAIASQSALAAAQTASIVTSASLARAESQLAIVEAARARTQVGFAIQEQAAAQRMLAGTTNTLIRANAVTKLALANSALIASNNALALTEARVAATTAAATTAANAATAATGRLAFATRGLSSAMAFLGGPVGVLVGTALALAMFVDWESDAEKQTAATTKEIDTQINAVDGLTTANLALAKTDLAEQQAELAIQLDEVNAKLKTAESNLLLASQSSSIAGSGMGKYSIQVFNATQELVELEKQQKKLNELGTKIKTVETTVATGKKDKIDLDKNAAADEAKRQLKRQAKSDAKFISMLADKFKTASQMEQKRYKEESEILARSYDDKATLTDEQQKLESDRLKQHQDNLKQIREDEDIASEIGQRFKSLTQLEQERYSDELARLRKSYDDKNKLTAAQVVLENKLAAENKANLAEIADEENVLGRMMEAFKSEEQLELERYTSKMDMFKEHTASMDELSAEHKQLELDIEAEHQGNMAAIRLANSPLELAKVESIGILEVLGLRYVDENALLVEKLANEAAILKADYEAKEITKKEYEALSLENTNQAANAKRQIELNERAETKKNVTAGFAVLIGQSKKAQNAMKAISIVNAIVKGKEAAVAAYASGMSTGGPWAPAVAASYAAASIANTASQIQSIRSGGKSSGGGGGGGAVSTPSAVVPAPAAAAPASAPRNIGINFSGNGLMNSDQVRELIGQIGEQLGDGVELNITG